MKKFSGRLLRKARQSANIRTEEVGRLLGVHQQTVTRWENGNAFPKIRFVGPLASVLGVQVDAFFEDE